MSARRLPVSLVIGNEKLTTSASFPSVLLDRRFRRALTGLAFLASFPLLFLVLLPSILAAQTKSPEAVQIISSRGDLKEATAGYTVVINGDVENTLPIAVTNVEITILFPADPTENPATTSLKRIAAKSKTGFTVSKSSKTRLSKYVAQVSEYRLSTTDVTALFSYFWGAKDDPVLREAAAFSIVNLPSDALRPAVEYFERSPASLDPSSAQNDLIDDLLLVSFFRTTKDASAAQALVKMSGRYSQEVYRSSFAQLKSYAQDGKTVIPVLNTAAKDDWTLLQVLTDALTTMGEPAVPILISSSESKDPILSQFAITSLRQMERETPAKQLAVQDPDVRLSVIRILTSRYRPDAVISLLQAASRSEVEAQLVVGALQSWRMQPVPQLLEALALPDSNAAARDLAERILISLGPSLLPTLTETLTTYQLANPAPTTVEDAIARLTQYHKAQRAARRAEFYAEGQTRLESGDCTGAVQHFDEVLSLQPSPNESLLSMAEAYDCAGDKAKAIQLIRQHIESNSGDAAAGTKLVSLLLVEADRLSSTVGPDAVISLLADAVVWHPDLALRERLAQLWADQGVAQRKQQQWQQALTSFRQARTVLPGFAFAIIEAGKTIVRKEWLYVVVSLAAATWVGIKIYLVQRSTGAKGS